MKIADFDFPLSPDGIALRPADRRDHSRLLVLHRDGAIEHKHFFDLAGYLRENDMLLLNNTKVFPARLLGAKPSGGKLDILLVGPNGNEGEWEVLRRGNYNGRLTLGDGIKAEIRTESAGPGTVRPRSLLRFTDLEPPRVYDVLWRHGLMPLPPYIKRQPDDTDKERYQTVYAEIQGSIAAPTAGMHFTGEMLAALRLKGVRVETLTLHVGVGTFKPVKSETVAGHRMYPEYFEIRRSLIDDLEALRSSGGRLITVGTTATRAIEGLMSGVYAETGPDRHGKDADSGIIRGHTDIFIYPGYEFRVVDCLITNFHLPRSTPLMLASAFAGRETILKAYKEAISVGYRFFSYGDAMLIL